MLPNIQSASYNDRNSTVKGLSSARFLTLLLMHFALPSVFGRPIRKRNNASLRQAVFPPSQYLYRIPCTGIVIAKEIILSRLSYRFSENFFDDIFIF
ncbi:hypothetical protein CEXT_62381 [Caerostris extrusa]|uniref:Uncharacterized protein n=1 Tax=Caerostris extrusa TaxID=172846 RepID=A0AAV4UCH8_CAEEX|nr:hypothetical protein CEXT_62381 [Caerostris extrusa]